MSGDRELASTPGEPESSAPTPTTPTILHVDMDAFYAAVEVRENPALRGRPVVIGADPREGRGRGVVSTASYEARQVGIGSAMPISEAYRRCPDAVFLKPRISLYAEVSDHIFDLFREYTDLVEPLSLDEAFLDVTGSRALFGDGPQIAATIKQEIRRRESLTASVGVAASKFLAKLASDLDKPDGLVVVPPGREREFLAPLEVHRLWGAGIKAQERFRQLGVRTIGQVADQGVDRLVQAFGESMGRRFHALALGQDPRTVVPGRTRKSLGREVTFSEDISDREVVEQTLFRLCDQVARSLRKRELTGATVSLKLRWEGFETVTRQKTLDRPINTTERLWPVARGLFRKADRRQLRVRLIGVSLSGLSHGAASQLGLFEADEPPVDTRVAEVVDSLAERFGEGSVTRAALLTDGRKRER
jgi:nucleotidyltransferase/DNA polymerase involved in DNA repair